MTICSPGPATPDTSTAVLKVGCRAETESVLLLVGLGAAAELAGHLSWTTEALRQREWLWECLQQTWGEHVVLNGHPTLRPPSTLNVSFTLRDGREILAAMPEVDAGRSTSASAACRRATSSPSS